MKNTGTLTVTLPSDNEVRLTRVFNAPRELVFEALTTPELTKQWYGPRGFHLIHSEIDLRVGGSWRFVLQMPNGRTMGLGGVYREIAPPGRLVSTEVFDDYGVESVVTTTLDEVEGRTTLISTVYCAQKEIRDAIIASGMEHGAAETYDRLEEFLAAVPR